MLTSKSLHKKGSVLQYVLKIDQSLFFIMFNMTFFVNSVYECVYINLS